MSALARYFNYHSKNIAGYDRTATPLTIELEKEGMQVHYTDDIKSIPPAFHNKENTLVVYTPAIPTNHTELNYFKSEGFRVMKRSAVLGSIIDCKQGIGVAGTHGKTTVSTMISYLLTETGFGCSAFLGGISKNYHTNQLVSNNSNVVVVEADEFDRSFLQLYPWLAIITATDSDHLDIYTDHTDLKNTFNQYAAQVKKGGYLLYKYGLNMQLPNGVHTHTYSLDNPNSDYYASNIIPDKQGVYHFNVHTPNYTIENISLQQRGLVNVENAIAAIAAATICGVVPSKISHAFKGFAGIWRRFDYQINQAKLVFIDDYAHHPEELKATISSVRKLYPGKKLTVAFQPHLYTRTRDFADGFAQALSMADELVLLDIYPAREEPIPGITSKIIFDKVSINNKLLLPKHQLIETIKNKNIEILLTLGAGDIDKEIEPLKKMLLKKYE